MTLFPKNAATENERLTSEIKRLRLLLAEWLRTIRAYRSHCDILVTENARVRVIMERAETERDAALLALGRQAYTAPYKELVAWNNGDGRNPRDKSNAEWIAIGRLRIKSAGFEAALAGEETT